MRKLKVDVGNATVVPREDYAQTLEEIVAGGFCPFCEANLFKHHQKPILWTSRYWLVTENSWPYKGSRLHILFIARKHIESIEKMTAPMMNGLLDLYRKLMRERKISGATLMIRSGNTSITGASVNHLHAQIIVGGKRKKNSKPITALVGFEK